MIERTLAIFIKEFQQMMRDRLTFFAQSAIALAPASAAPPNLWMAIG